MVSPRPPLTKRYGPSKPAGTRTDLVHRRFEPSLIDTGLLINDVGEVLGNYMGERGIDRNDFDTEPEEDEIVTHEVLVERALAAFRRAESRRDGLVEMEEREWQAWNRHQAMELEIEKRVMEREREREIQREMMEMERQRQLGKRKPSPARSERPRRSPSVSRARSGSETRNRSGSATGAYGLGFGNVGEPGFLDSNFVPPGYSSSTNSSPKISHSSTASPPRLDRPYSRQTRDPRMIAPSEIGHHNPPRYARDINPSYSSLSAASSPHPRVTVPLYPTTSSYKASISPSPSFLESSSTTLPHRRSNALNRNVGSMAGFPPGASYYPGKHPSIPGSSSVSGFGGSDREDSSSGGGDGRSRGRRGL